MKRALLFSALLFASTFSFAGNSVITSVKRNCATMDNLHRPNQIDPGLKARMEHIESFTRTYTSNKYGENRINSVITIPVVFHIVYNNSSQNLTDAQCQAQINQLNLDFAKMNSDTSNIPGIWQNVAANTGIQFCLAQRDPNGAATNGIERRNTAVSSFTTDDNVKFNATGGLNAWPSSSYLNIWTANISGGVLGYAQFPGGPASTDGIVLHYATAGSIAMPGTMTNYNLGRTATHEVGHWLNLIHIWGDEPSCGGSDLVGDTPDQGSENYGCPSFPVLDICSGTSPGVMFMNYMDYTDDACMNMFTTGQSTRMNALFSSGGFRASLAASNGCQAPPPSSSCGPVTGLTSSAITSSAVALSWATVSGATSYILKHKKGSVSSWTVSTVTGTSKNLSGLSANTAYQWQVQPVCSLGGGTNSSVATFTTSVAPPCGTPASLNSTMISANGATLSWGAVSGAYSYTVQYKITGAIAWTTVTSSSTSKIISGLTAATPYTFQVMATCQSGSGGYSSTASFVTAASNCTDNNEPNNTYSANTIIPTNTDITGQINVANDVDWFGFTTTAPNTKIMVVLSNLPKDYNVSIYNASFVQIGTSNGIGMSNDTIKKNFTSPGTYYLRVFGKNGAFSATSCYNLRVNVSGANFRVADDDLENDINNSIQSELNIYPNPVKDNLNVSFTSAGNPVTVRIYDMIGKTIKSIPFEAVSGENRLMIDFTEFKKGIYFLELIEPDSRMTKKIIRE